MQRILKLRGGPLRDRALDQRFGGVLPRPIAGARFQPGEHMTLGLVNRSEGLAGLVFDGAGQLHGTEADVNLLRANQSYFF